MSTMTLTKAVTLSDFTVSPTRSSDSGLTGNNGGGVGIYNLTSGSLVYNIDLGNAMTGLGNFILGNNFTFGIIIGNDIDIMARYLRIGNLSMDAYLKSNSTVSRTIRFCIANINSSYNATLATSPFLSYYLNLKSVTRTVTSTAIRVVANCSNVLIDLKSKSIISYDTLTLN